MPTIIFDFDSTLIREESLEQILNADLTASQQQQLAELTDLGMEGKLSFHESLQKRFEIAQPTQQAIQAYTPKLEDLLTTGMAELIHDCHAQDIDIWIISGGLQEVIAPLAKILNIPNDKIHAVTLKWHNDGTFKDIDTDNPFCHGKIAGAAQLASSWKSPNIVVGDGFTDWELYRQGLVDHFIAFTEHAKRDFLRELTTEEADSVHALRQGLADTLGIPL